MIERAEDEQKGWETKSEAQKYGRAKFPARQY